METRSPRLRFVGAGLVSALAKRVVDQEAEVLGTGPGLAVQAAEGDLEQDQAEDRADLEEEVEIETEVAEADLAVNYPKVYKYPPLGKL